MIRTMTAGIKTMKDRGFTKYSCDHDMNRLFLNERISVKNRINMPIFHTAI